MEIAKTYTDTLAELASHLAAEAERIGQQNAPEGIEQALYGAACMLITQGLNLFTRLVDPADQERYVILCAEGASCAFFANDTVLYQALLWRGIDAAGNDERLKSLMDIPRKLA